MSLTRSIANEQLFTGMEVNSGEYLLRSGEVNIQQFTDTEVNNCFGIYHT